MCNEHPFSKTHQNRPWRTPLKAGWLAPNISPQGFTSLSPMEFMTSDHSEKTLLSSFAVLLGQRSGDMRTNPRNLLA
jgi:hypothetical protein